RPYATLYRACGCVLRQCVGSYGMRQHAEPVSQECAVDRRVGQRERVEAGRLARANSVVAPADAADEQFARAVLVEQDRARAELLRLRGEEVHHHGLARARRADDREVAEIAVVEVEEE